MMKKMLILMLVLTASVANAGLVDIVRVDTAAGVITGFTHGNLVLGTDVLVGQTINIAVVATDAILGFDASISGSGAVAFSSSGDMMIPPPYGHAYR